MGNETRGPGSPIDEWRQTAKSSPWVFDLPFGFSSHTALGHFRTSLNNLWEPKIMTMRKAMVMCQIGHATFQAVLCSLQSECPYRYQAGGMGGKKRKEKRLCWDPSVVGPQNLPCEHTTYRHNIHATISDLP